MPDLEGRPRRVAGGILLAGFAAAILIYVGAAPEGDRPDERLEDSKQYVRQMEVYGGTANVLASEARRWIASLWHGRRLAITVACLSTLLAGLAYVALTPLPPDAQGSGRDRTRMSPPRGQPPE